MQLSHSASESGWLTHPAALWNEHKGEDVPPFPFWRHCLDKYRGPLLDLGCGNGRHTLPLAAYGSGREAVGIDISADLVASANARLQEWRDSGRDVEASFVVGDIANFDLGQTFPLAIMTCWTFQVLLTQEDQIAFLQCVHRHLAPGGAFAFNVFMPFNRQREHGGLTERIGTYEWPLGSSYHGGARRTYDPATQIETALDFGKHPIKLRHTGLSEIRLLFRLTGFEITEIYGDDQDMRPFTAGPDNDYTIIAERR